MSKERIAALVEINADLRRKNKALSVAVKDMLRTIGTPKDTPSKGTMWGTINEMRNLIKTSLQ